MLTDVSEVRTASIIRAIIDDGGSSASLHYGTVHNFRSFHQTLLSIFVCCESKDYNVFK
jgi:hypothetical protein